MRKSRFTEEQIIKVLKEHAAGLSASEARRGSEKTYPDACAGEGAGIRDR